MRIRLPGSDSSSWVLAEAMGSAVLSLGSMLLIGRIIGPEAAGIGIIAISSYLLLDLAATSLFVEALVQRTALTRRHSDSAITAAVLVGIVTGCMLALGGGLLNTTADPSEVSRLCLALAPLLPLSALSSAATGLLLRARRFRLIALRVLVAQPLGLVVGALAAMAGFGPWAMVALQATVTLTGVILVLAFGRLGIRPLLDLRAVRELLPVAGPQSAATFVEAGKYRFFVVALGTTAAGAAVAQAHFAFRFLDALLVPVWQVASRLALPRLCALQHDRAALAEAYGELAQLQALLGLPAAVGLALTVPDIVLLLLGPAWTGTADAARIAALGAGAFFALGCYGPLFIAVGRAGRNFAISLASFALQIFSLAVLRPGTPWEIGLAWALPALVLVPVLAVVILRELRRTAFWLAAWIAPAVLATAAMAAVILLIQHAADLPPHMSLALSVSAGVATFAGVAWVALGRRLPLALGWSGSLVPAE